MSHPVVILAVCDRLAMMQQLVTLCTKRHRMSKTSEVTMASEHPDADATGRVHPSASRQHSATELLRRLLRRQMLRHLNTPFTPAITVLGFDNDRGRVLRIGIDRPEDAVLGLVLPARYNAVGVLAASVVATPPRRAHRDAALALGVLRSGETVSMLATTDGEITATSRPQGWLIDACQRAVGLATEPCAAAALTLPIALWLDRVMVALLNEPQHKLTWVDVAHMCPVPGRWRSSDPVDLGTTLGSTTPSWSALRQATIGGTRTLAGVSSAHARWMDDAMFARWCLGSFPELTSLRSDVEFLAPDNVAQNIDLALRAAWTSFT